MAMSRIPLPGLPGKGLADNSQELLKQMLQKKANEDKLQQEYFANEQLNQYRQGSLGLEREKLAASQALKPLQMELLREKILAARNTKNETPEQKSQRRIEEKISIAEGIENRKAGSKLITAGRELNEIVNKATRMNELLKKRPDLTGIIQGAKSKYNLSEDKDLAEFDQLSRDIQSHLARYASVRGGQAALQFAEKAKPSLFKKTKYNLGMLESILNNSKEQHLGLSGEYKDRLNKEYPLKFPEIVSQNEQGQQTQITEPSGNVFNWIMKNGKLVRK